MQSYRRRKIFLNGLIGKTGNQMQDIWVRNNHFRSFAGPRHIGPARELGITNIITWVVAQSCQMNLPPINLFLLSRKTKIIMAPSPNLNFKLLYLLKGTNRIYNMPQNFRVKQSEFEGLWSKLGA